MKTKVWKSDINDVNQEERKDEDLEDTFKNKDEENKEYYRRQEVFLDRAQEVGNLGKIRETIIPAC